MRSCAFLILSLNAILCASAYAGDGGVAPSPAATADARDKNKPAAARPDAGAGGMAGTGTEGQAGHPTTAGTSTAISLDFEHDVNLALVAILLVVVMGVVVLWMVTFFWSRKIRHDMSASMDNLRQDIARQGQELAALRASGDVFLRVLPHIGSGRAPRITSVQPSSAAAGATVLVLGGSLSHGRVWFGSTEAPAPEIVDDGALRVKVPAGLAGTVNVLVQGPDGVSAPQSFTITSQASTLI